MNKKKIFNIILASVLTGSMATALFINPIRAFAEIPLDSLEKVKVLEMDFNNNKAINIINDNEYFPTNNNANYVSSTKGNGYEANDSKIIVPFTDLGVTANDSVLTVSFLFKYDKNDDMCMPISFVTQNNNIYDLWFNSGFIGFNTGNRELYGISNPFSDTNKFYSVIAEFNFNDITKSKLYIDGVEQTLSYKFQGTSYLAPIDKETGSLCIGGLKREDMYNIKNKSIIDEIKLYKKSLTTDEINAVSKSQQIPELRTEVVNNKNVSVSWATEILQENLLWNAGFEENENRPSLSYSKSPVTGSILGEQSFSADAKYSGYLGYQLLDTYNGKGNNFLFPQTQSNSSKTTWSSLKNVIDRNMNLSISVMAKSTGNSKFSIAGQGGFEIKLYSWTSKLVKDVTKGDFWLYVDKLDPSWKVQSDGVTPAGHYKVFPDEVDEYIMQDNHIKEIDVENKRIRLAKGVYRDMKAGETLKRRSWVNPFSGGGASIGNTNTWTLYNFNTTVTNNSYYDPMSRGFALIMGNSTDNTLYLDDLKLGYATKVKLYRNNSKIYEGYASTFNDTSATDKATPNTVTNIKYDMDIDNNLNRSINVTFNASEDNGTSYNYNITSVDNDNIESPLSITKTQTVTSGIKGYSYVIDKSSSTVPDNTVDTTTNSIKSTITDSGVYYVHIKAIDNAGNVSSVVHHKIDIPTLTVKANSSEDMIRLDWSLSDSSNKIFKIYQKKEGSNEFQSISATNLNKPVKVLLAYPERTCTLEPQPTTTYIDNKGNTITLPISASIKKWMEEPKAQYPNGYGMGLIQIDIVPLSVYSSNPNETLKNSNGDYKYDVFAIGIADCNGYETITAEAGEAIGDFIESGRGVFFGHDTVYSDSRQTIADVAEKYMNMKVVSGTSYRDSVVRITKKGLLTNFPHNIGEVGSLLNIPLSHTSNQVPNSIQDNWLIFNNGTSSDVRNFYLTTYNNMAMSQTGHSTGQATEDEQKVLANTLFYLNQLSNDNFLDDYSGQDVKAPNIPSIKTVHWTNGNLEVYLNEAQDNGSEYKYYVKSENKENEIAISNVVTETITSGVKGYSYVIDKNPTTEPDNTIELTNTSENISYSLSDDDKILYIHVKAIDNVGNVSETLHYKVEDTNAPTLNVTNNPTDWTNKDVTLNISANDLESGLSYILLPNGNKVTTDTTTDTTTYTVSTNGTYTFKAYDKVGNEVVVNIVVNKIDKEIPIINYTKEFNSNKTSGYINLSVIDTQSGFSKLQLPTGEIITTSTYKYPINNNGMYLFTAWDKANNKSILGVTVDELNTNDTASGISKIEYKLSGATIKDWTTYTEPFYITNEGITTITARSYDKAGNISSEATSQVKIDKTKPINNGIEIKLK